MHFYWPGMKEQIQNVISECDICQRNKDERVPYPGLLQPLPVPEKSWSHISMDFIEGLLTKVNGEKRHSGGGR